MVIIDIEASSLDTNNGSILSIGAVDFNNVTNTFYGECRLREGAKASNESLQIAGFNENSINDPQKPLASDLIKRFLNWLSEIEDRTIAGQNPQFDLEYLRNEMKRAKIDFIFGTRIVDLHSVAYFKMLQQGVQIPLRNNRTDIDLDYIMKYCGIDKVRSTHNALEDALIEAECFMRLMSSL